MGDMGSFQSAIIIAFLLIELFFINSNTLPSKYNVYENLYLITLVVPSLIYDFFYVTIFRLKSKKNIFVGDTNHINHKINSITKNPNITFWYLFLLNFFIILFCLFLFYKNFNTFQLFLIITLIHIINYLFLHYKILNKTTSI